MSPRRTSLPARFAMGFLIAFCVLVRDLPARNSPGVDRGLGNGVENVAGWRTKRDAREFGLPDRAEGSDLSTGSPSAFGPGPFAEAWTTQTALPSTPVRVAKTVSASFPRLPRSLLVKEGPVVDSVQAIGALGSQMGRLAAAVVRPHTMPQFEVDPLPPMTDVYLGQPATIQVTYTGGVPILFRWRRDGIVIPGATQDALFFPKVEESDAALYFVDVAHEGGVIQKSTRLRVFGPATQPPSFARLPLVRTVPAGINPQFTVDTDGDGVLNYQWFYNDAALEIPSSRTLTLNRIHPNQAGRYHVVVSNTLGSVRSNPMVVEVILPLGPNAPSIEFSEWNGVLPALCAITSTSPQPTDEIHYTLDGSEPTADSPRYNSPIPINTETTVRAALFTEGYRISYFRAAEFLRSPIPPQIERSPTSLVIKPPARATTDVVASGSLPLLFEWYRDGQRILSSTNPIVNESPYVSALLVDSSVGEVSTYHVVVRNSAGSATSAPFTVSAPVPPVEEIVPPSFVRSVGDALGLIGARMVLRAEVAGSYPMTFTWSVPGFGTLSSRTNWIEIPTMGREHEGLYQVSVENSKGRATSGPARIHLTSRPQQGSPALMRQPAAVTARPGASVVLWADVVGSPPFTSHWRFESGLTITTNTPWLTLAEISEAVHGGSYQVTLENAYGSVTSVPASLKLVPSSIAPPKMGSLPIAISATEGRFLTIRLPIQVTTPLKYHWRLAGTSVFTTDSPEISVGSALMDYRGDAVVVVENSSGSLLAGPLPIIVWPSAKQPPPTIVREPADVNAPYGGSVSLSVEAAPSLLELNYTWYKDETILLQDRTSPVLTLHSLTPATVGKSYHVVIRSRDGRIRSRSVRVTLDPPIAPVLVKQPADLVVDEGSMVQWEVKAQGSPRLVYSWYFKDELLSGYYGPSLDLYDVQLAQAGDYFAVVTNAGGAVRSGPHHLTVRPRPPVIHQHPADVSVLRGADVLLEVRLSGTLPYTFQWRVDHVPIAGATNNPLRLQSVTPAQSGIYDVVVSNAVGEDTSHGARLHVADPGGGTIQFVNRVTGLLDAPVFAEDGVTLLAGPGYQAQLYAGTTTAGLSPIGLPVPFRSGAGAGYWDTGGDPLRYLPMVPAGGVAWVQVRVWALADGFSFEAASAARAPVGASLPISVATGGVGTPPSLPAALLGLSSFQLRRTQPPSIVTEPQPASLGVGEPLTLTVAARGEQLAYQWYHDGIAIPGGTSETYGIEATAEDHAGLYHVRVSNPGGTTLSSEVRVSVSIHRQLLLSNVGAVPEGGIPRLPLQLWRRVDSSDVGRVEATLRYDPAFLTWLDLEAPFAQAPVREIDSATPGEVRLAFSLRDGFSTGTNTLGFALFRARDVASNTVTTATLAGVRFFDLEGNPLPSGLHQSGTPVEILSAPLTGDNNGNGFLDLGDPALIETLITRPAVTIPKWMISENDFDLNGRLDRADVRASLDALVARDLEFLRPGAKTGDRKDPRRPLGTPVEALLELTTPGAALPLVPGDKVTVRVGVRAQSTGLRAASFTLRFPAAAIVPRAARELAAGTLWPNEGTSTWKATVPATPDGSGRIRFAATTSRDWAPVGGALVEWDFEVLPGASSRSQYLLELEDILWTRDGYAIGSAADEAMAVAVRPRLPPKFDRVSLVDGSSGVLVMEGSADSDVTCRVQVHNGLGQWVDDGALEVGSDGTFQVMLPISREVAGRLYRIIVVPEASRSGSN